MKRFIKLIIVLSVVLLFIYVAGNAILAPKKFISPIPNIIPSPTSLPSSSSLKKVVEGALSGTKGTYGIVIKNFKTGEAYYKDDHRIFEPGSLYKLWVMAEVFAQIQNGEIKEDEILSDSVTNLNSKFDIDPGVAELTDGTITLSVKDALEQMITISHNYAAYLLTDRVELSNVAKFLEKQNFSESMLGAPPKTTAYDIAQFFEKLYKGELGNAENTQKMLDLLKKQALDSKLPKYLPGNTDIAHKTGEIDYFTHDAGIVYTPKGDYIIVVLSESDSPAGAEDRIAQASQAVYEYFTSK